MNSVIFLEQITVAAVAVLAAILYGRSAMRTDPEQSAPARYVVALVGVLMAVSVLLGWLAPVLSYAVLCLTIVSVYAADLNAEERAHRRRVASLAPRPVAAAIPALWVATAAASSLMLVPYVLLGEQQIAALIVGLCSLAMAAIAWRLATAPVLIVGEDAVAARARDRARRELRVSLAAATAVAIAFVFMSFVNAQLPVVLPVQRVLHALSVAVWVVLWAWGWWRYRRFSRAARCAP